MENLGFNASKSQMRDTALIRALKIRELGGGSGLPGMISGDVIDVLFTADLLYQYIKSGSMPNSNECECEGCTCKK